MNCKIIEKSCPKAFKKLKWFYKNIPIQLNEEGVLGWYFSDGIHHVKMWEDMSNDMLFDFFDKMEIYILLDEMWLMWIYNKKTNREYKVKGKDRRSVTDKAFTKVFSILNKQL